MIWSKCGAGFVYKGVRSEHRHLFTYEDAVYIDIDRGVVWTVDAQAGAHSVLVRAISLLQHPEVIETVKLEEAERLSFERFISGAMEQGKDGAALWMEQLPEGDRDMMLEAILSVATYLEDNDRPWFYERRSLAGEAYRVLEDHGIGC